MSQSRVKKNNTIMFGSISIVGKDSKGVKILLPTNDESVRKDPWNDHNLQKSTRWEKIKAFFKKRIREYELVTINRKMGKSICREYDQEVVSPRIFKAQEEAKRQKKRAAMGFNY